MNFIWGFVELGFLCFSNFLRVSLMINKVVLIFLCTMIIISKKNWVPSYLHKDSYILLCGEIVFFFLLELRIRLLYSFLKYCLLFVQAQIMLGMVQSPQVVCFDFV